VLPQLDLAQTWHQNHKKSLATVFILLSLTSSPKWSKEIADFIFKQTNWQITLDQKSLHRALRRLESLSLISSTLQPAPKTGARRKIYSLTDQGTTFLNQIAASSLGYLSSPALQNLMH
jgi:DNA-binding PadR family transcriptional regulator